MCENEATEGGVVFEELSAVRSHVVDRGSSSEGACNAPGVLLASGSRGILEEVTYGICSSGEREVGLRGDEGSRPRTVERIITRREELYVLPEPKMPWTQREV